MSSLDTLESIMLRIRQILMFSFEIKSFDYENWDNMRFTPLILSD